MTKRSERVPRAVQRDPDLLTRRQAAEYAHVSLSTIDRALREGKLSKVRLYGGNRVTIRRQELDRWISADEPPREGT
jgi:excisionase family DNA binding protein